MSEKGKVHTSVLIPKHRYQALLAIERESGERNYLPTMEKLSTLDKELVEILKNESLTLVEKIRQYSKVMTEYLKFQKKLHDQGVSAGHVDISDTGDNDHVKEIEKSTEMETEDDSGVSNTGLEVENEGKIKQIDTQIVDSKSKLTSKPSQHTKTLKREKKMQERNRILSEWLYW